ncbi:MAG: universal stress protein [Spirosomataceae bacterium]
MATTVALKAKCPVLVIPSKSEVETIKQVLYATELERPEKNALGFSFDLTEHFNASLSLIKVNAPFEVNVFDDTQFVKEIEAVFGTKKFNLHIVEADSVLDGLKYYAEENHTDLLVMATRQRDWLSELINPSFSKKMIATTNIPLLVCHLQEEA